MKKILNTLKNFSDEDLFTIEVALNNEIKSFKEGIEIMKKVDDLETIKVYEHKKAVLDKLWVAIFNYKLGR